MEKQIVFCSPCDRNVTLVARTSPTLWRIVLPSDPDRALQCLDQGVRCTGSLCPYAADEEELGGGFKEFATPLAPPTA